MLVTREPRCGVAYFHGKNTRVLCIFVPAPDIYAHAGEVVPDDAAQHIVT